jgi:hypothetical protein
MLFCWVQSRWYLVYSSEREFCDDLVFSSKGNICGYGVYSCEREFCVEPCKWSALC